MTMSSPEKHGLKNVLNPAIATIALFRAQAEFLITICQLRNQATKLSLVTIVLEIIHIIYAMYLRQTLTLTLVAIVGLFDQNGSKNSGP